MSDQTVLHENDNYFVTVKPSGVAGTNMDVYHVVNKKTGVTEMEETMMPRAFEYCEQLDGALKDWFKEQEKPTTFKSNVFPLETH